MSDNLGFPHDHEEIAWQHFLSQHIGKKNTEDFVRSFYGPLKTLDGVLQELYVERWIETAEGNALDGIGSIVGITRYAGAPIYIPFFGFVSQPSGRAFGVARMRKHSESYAEMTEYADAEYRMAILCKIALNNSHGTAEEIMWMLNNTLKITGSHLFDVGNATVSVWIPELLDPSDPEYYMIEQMIPKAAGVKIWITMTDPNYVFGFVNKGDFYGFGVGVMARRIV